MGGNNSGASAGSVALAFLSGILLGAATAFLMAPQTGRESRETLLRAARRASDDFKDLSERATDTWGEVVTKGKDFVDEAGAIVKDAIDTGQDAIRRKRGSSNDEPYS
ncbi:MAG: YtxH domain-containing protein [Nitrospirota bacterium]|nr:YtxH domain-containing protein [Nitrospirota bacterium]